MRDAPIGVLYPSCRRGALKESLTEGSGAVRTAPVNMTRLGWGDHLPDHRRGGSSAGSFHFSVYLVHTSISLQARVAAWPIISAGAATGDKGSRGRALPSCILLRRRVGIRHPWDSAASFFSTFCSSTSFSLLGWKRHYTRPRACGTHGRRTATGGRVLPSQQTPCHGQSEAVIIA